MKIKISKSQWNAIGKKAGWIKKAQTQYKIKANDSDIGFYPYEVIVNMQLSDKDIETNLRNAYKTKKLLSKELQDLQKMHDKSDNKDTDRKFIDEARALSREIRNVSSEIDELENYSRPSSGADGEPPEPIY